MKHHTKKLFFLLLISSPIFSCQKQEESIYLKEGNLALPTSQMPGPLFSFGQTTVDKHDVLFYGFTDYLHGVNKNYSDVVLGVLYGITDEISLFINVPFAPKHQQDTMISSGVEDIFVQLEWEFICQETPTACNDATLVGGIFFPTGEFEEQSLGASTRILPISFGSPTFFLGATAKHLATKWYAYASPGALITTKHTCENTKLGNQFFYEAGIGRNIGNPWGCVLTWILELNGTYAMQDRIEGLLDPNSGGNVVFVGPDLFFSSEKLILQAGIEFPIVQNFIGQQSKNSFIIAFDFFWKFN